MPTSYLFRIDGNTDNDVFFEGARTSAHCVWRGTDFRIGKGGWIPDLVKIVIADDEQEYSLTLIELEAFEGEALKSCRKYLPESSAEVIRAFNEYLDRVLRECRTTADSRDKQFGQLKGLMSRAKRATVMTMGALRSSIDAVEVLPLIDQGCDLPQSEALSVGNGVVALQLAGDIRLGHKRAKSLSRCILILDEALRNRGHSDATYHSWQAKHPKPLEQLVLQSGRLPVLQSLLSPESKRHGLQFHAESLCRELSTVWSSMRQNSVAATEAQYWVETYFAQADRVRPDDRMHDVLESARVILNGATGHSAPDPHAHTV